MLIRHLTAITAVVVLTILGPAVDAAPPALPSTEQAIGQVLNRLTFGPRPGDVARVKSEGLDAWVERQLNPSRIDDSGMTERLARLSTLGLDSQALVRDIHQPARGERQRLQREGRDGTTPQAMNETIRRDRQIVTDLSEAKLLRAVYSDRQLEEVLVDFWFNHFNVFAGKGPTRVWIAEFEHDAIRANVLGNFRTMLGAVAKSPAMLFYLDNWMNVDPRQAADGRRQTVRLRSPDSTRASAFAEASADRRSFSGGRSARQAQQGQVPRARRATGLNENYARELMELHTLGVDGGYTQQDVVNVARAFTGWALRLGSRQSPEPRSGQGMWRSGFYFDPRLHDAGEKVVLGHTIKAGGGIEDGEQVLDILAAHPATAQFIAEKLARRFVSDEPPPNLVKRAAARFSATHGDLRETLRVIITSPEFFAPEAYRAKVKTPFEFVVSAFRATGADVRAALPVVRELREMGMPLYLCQPPTGYDDTAGTWVSSGALVSRMNFALAIGGNRLRGISVPFAADASVPAVRTALLSDALAGSASAGTIATVDKATTVEQAVALALGSPEFQRK
jgi:uncharacterized protein (DUF1800 family)